MPAYTDNLCFWHIAKTGGLWARHAMRNAGISTTISHDGPKPTTHLPPSMVPGLMDGRFNFTFVRDPYEWLRSWYCAREGDRWPDMEGPSIAFRTIWRDDFAGFIGEYERIMPGAVGRMFARFTDGMDFVGRTEDQPFALLDALTASGVDFDADAIRNTPRRNEARAEVKAMCADPDDSLRFAVYAAERDYCERYGYGPFVASGRFEASGSAA